MRVLVTGATGRIGANVVKQLVAAGHHVRAQVRPESDRLEKLRPFDVEACPVDLRDRERLSALVPGADAIIHLGAKLRGPGNYDHLDVNIAPTFTLLEATRTLNPGLRRFVYGSSDVLYPHTGWMPTPILESDKFVRPNSTYAVTKVAGESIVHSYHRQYGIPAVTLNIPMTFAGRELLGERSKEFSPYTADQIAAVERQPPSEARDRCLAELRRHLAEGRPLVVPVCPEGPPWKRHLGDVRDVAAACVLALTAPAAVGQTLVIMSDALDYGVGVPHLARVAGMDYAEVVFPHAMYYWYDMSRTHDLLGYRSAYDSRRILEDAYRHQQGEEIGVVPVGPTTPL
ncbi:MAG: NAD(P)-dependent oxidoreductase [Armatimonadetes bacterium]|nr:NAD(P)-dependent oxidoreductase [Armatimonadota bacterium]